MPLFVLSEVDFFNCLILGFPVTADLLRKEARIYNEKHNIRNGWIPKTKWYYGFLHRHPDISLRTPQYISHKKQCVKESDIREWYAKVSREKYASFQVAMVL